MNKWVIRQGRVLDPATHFDQVADVFVDKGKVVSIGGSPAGFDDAPVINAEGRWVFPGVVDLKARPREPGYTQKGSIASEAMAAVRAGVTTMVCPPDTRPVIDTPAVVELIERKVEEARMARVLPQGAMTVGLQGELLAPMATLASSGCVAFSNADVPLKNTMVLRRALEYASNFGYRIVIQPTDHALSAKGCAHEGAFASRLGLRPIPVAAETSALAQVLELNKDIGAHIHFSCISSMRAVELLAEAKAEGSPVTASVSAHQLFLTDIDIESFDSTCHVLPPLRSHRDREALRQGVLAGTIDAIVSDHQPHDMDAKLAPFPATEPGMSTIETLLPLVMRLVNDGVLPLMTALERITSGSAACLGLPYGSLAEGRVADIVVFDPKIEYSYDRSRMRSAGKHTAFHGWDFQGRVVAALVAGEATYLAK